MVKDPKNNMNACEDFILDVTDAHILVAFMTELGLSSMEETPTRLIPLKSCDSLSQRSALLDETRQLVDKYVDLALKTDLASTSKLKDDDHVLNYARDTLTYGLLLKEFNDAIHEGDGTRILRCWKYFLFIFRATKRTNYSVDAFNMLAQYYCIFSPRMAEQILWSRTVNVHGQAGRNCPVTYTWSISIVYARVPLVTWALISSC